MQEEEGEAAVAAAEEEEEVVVVVQEDREDHQIAILCILIYLEAVDNGLSLVLLLITLSCPGQVLHPAPLRQDHHPFYLLLRLSP